MLLQNLKCILLLLLLFFPFSYQIQYDRFDANTHLISFIDIFLFSVCAVIDCFNPIHVVGFCVCCVPRYFIYKGGDAIENKT